MSAQALAAPRRQKNRRPAWEEKPSPLGQGAKALVLAFMVFAVLFPLWSIIVTSLSSEATINAAGGMVVIPRGFDPSAYALIFSRGEVSRAVWTSTIVAVGGTAFSLTLTVLAAYGLSRPGTFAHRPLLFWFLITFLIGPGIVPSYLVVSGFGLIDSLWALIIPSAISAFNLVVIRAFFMNIPGELIDSARIDGASELRILTRIVLPLSKAVVAVVGLFYAVGYWNAFFNAMLYINDPDKRVVQRVLQSYILLGQTPQMGGQAVSIPGFATAIPPTLAVKMAVVVVTLVPIAIVYPFVQRHFTKGVIIGAVKG
jgi:putative aldouronate transport system permease protein